MKQRRLAMVFTLLVAQGALASEGKVLVTIHDALGRGVGTIAKERESAGTHGISWAAVGLPSGVYYVTVIYRAGRAGRAGGSAAAFRTIPVLFLK